MVCVCDYEMAGFGMSENNMHLENLTMFDFSDEKVAAHGAKIEAEIQTYKDKYGDGWYEHWHGNNVRKQTIIRMRLLNCKIYDTGRLTEIGRASCRERV